MPKFTIHKRDPLQIIFALVMILLLIYVGISSLSSLKNSLKLAGQIQVSSEQSTEISITQRDILMYGIRLNQWVHGEVTRQDVQTARVLLSQRLDGKGLSNFSLAQEAVPGFLTALWNADAWIAQAPAGYLPALMQKSYYSNINPALETIVSDGNLLVEKYRNAINQQVQTYTNSERKATLWTLNLLITRTILGLLFIIWLVAGLQRRYQQHRLSSRRSVDHLEEAEKELYLAHRVVKSLRQENTDKSEIVATVNHELRTPLTSIIGYIDIMKEFSLTKGNKEFHQYLDIMDRNATVLLDLIEDILAFSALNSRTVLTATTNIDLVKICERCAVGLQLQIESSNININYHYDLEENYTVRGDDNLLARVFTNLISNAIKFSPKNSNIDIIFSRTKSENLQAIVRIEVKDQGIGIPEDEIDKLFFNFFRARNAYSNNIPGSGLGLAIVKKIVELHGGKISAKSKLSNGTTMTIDMPFEASPVEAMVMAQRQDVLERAITSLSESSAERLAETAHNVGGTIGFYTFLDESKEVLDLSHWLEKNPFAEREVVLAKKEDLLLTLNASLARLKGEVIS